MTELTTEEWIARAQSATDPAEIRRCLDAAGSAAEGVYDLRQLLMAELSLGETGRIARIVERTLEAAGIEGETWAFVDVAQARAGALGDPEGAARALKEAEPLLALDEISGVWGWCHLAAAWQGTLCRREEARYCLQRAEEAATEPSDLCEVALGLARLLGEQGMERARALLARAETLASEHEVWTLANTWRELSALGLAEPQSAAQMLDQALERAGQSDGALTIARAWEEHGRPDKVRLALARAALLASTAEDWLELARTQHELGQPADALSGALERAEALAGEDEGLREQIEEARERWLKGTA